MSDFWRPLPGYARHYWISREGDVKSLATLRVMQPRPDPKRMGRLKIDLQKGDEKKTYWVHTLVLLAHVGPRPSRKHEAHHRDFDVTNNRVENLEWLTREENIEASMRAGRLARKLRPELVIDIRRWCKNRVMKQAIIAQLMGINERTVRKIASGEIWGWV